MANNQGWIKLHRSITDSPEWRAEPFTRSQAWIDLLLLANHKTGHIRIRGILVTVERGQVGYSEETLAIRWRWSRGKVRRFLQHLIELSQISRNSVQQNPRVSSLITITNYELYQANDTTNDTTKSQQTVQEQECKNNKKKEYSFDSVEYELSSILLNKIIERLPSFKNPDLQKWSRDVDLMIRIDNRQPEEIQRVIEWSQANDFWKKNILSTSGLRKHFDKLQANIGEVSASW